jgi:glutathione S-transferase
MKFFHLPASCSSAVHAALKITGAPFEMETVDLANKSEAFQAANPLGKVPAILDDHGPMFEGGAINLWLAAKFPDAGLMPDLASDEGREALKWLFFCYGTIHPIWVRLFFPQRMAGDGDHSAVKKLAHDDLKKNYRILAGALATRPYLAGEKLSLADLYVAATFHWEAAIDGGLTRNFPEIAELKSRVMANPGVSSAFAGEIFDIERNN